MTSILVFLITPIARLYLWRYRPTIVAVTGNVGKTTTKEAIAAVLAKSYRVRASAGNLNNEFGMPLSILGGYEEEYYRKGGVASFWLRVLLTAPFKLIADANAPQVLVLEYGADKPGDIARMVRLFPPTISVVTAVGEVPVHGEFFASALHLANEKMQLIKHLPVQGHAILNYDDLTVLEMRSHTKAHVHTFGAGQGAEVQVTDIHSRLVGLVPSGISFNITDSGHTMPVVVQGTLGRGIASACAAAAAVASIMHVGLAHAVEVFGLMPTPAGRMRILEGIKGSVIIDDTYNSSPAAAHLAIETVKDLPGRKVLVLGDMLELGAHEVQAHESIGNFAGDVAGVLVCVGARAKFTADAAANQMPVGSIYHFNTSLEAAPVVQSLIQPGDVVLVKGSQGMRMERVVKEIMAQPQRAGELLVRQSARWLAK